MQEKTPHLTAAEMQSHYTYNPETGLFTHARLGHTTAGFSKGAGDMYKHLMIAGKRYRAHRLAFLVMTGEIPTVVDHIDGDPTNNKWENLRAVTPQQNTHNTHKPRSKKSKAELGVSWDTLHLLWRAQIRVDYAKYYIGLYDTQEEAALAYWAVKKTVHPFAPDVCPVTTLDPAVVQYIQQTALKRFLSRLERKTNATG